MQTIEQLPAGRELDALIAEKVMGMDLSVHSEHEWKTCQDGSIVMAYNPFDPHNGPQCVRCGYGYCHHCEAGPSEPCQQTPPNYSTDIAAAWQVLERANLLVGKVDGLWMVTNTNDFQSKQLVVSVSDSAPLAICHAALKVLKGGAQ